MNYNAEFDLRARPIFAFCMSASKGAVGVGLELPNTSADVSPT
jgi:hypothetical protein